MDRSPPLLDIKYNSNFDNEGIVSLMTTLELIINFRFRVFEDIAGIESMQMSHIVKYKFDTEVIDFEILEESYVFEF
jgi:hypothetical protein